MNEQKLIVLLENQLSSFLQIMFPAAMESLNRSDVAAPGKWSAREQLAHIACYHELFLARLSRMLNEPDPALPQYRAEDDPLWPQWRAMPAETLLPKTEELRHQLIQTVHALTPEQWERTGRHSKFGSLTVAEWLEFFLVHEGHHLYAMFPLLRTGM
jgi:uncharacterized damage-inducible protein DinB